MKRYLLPLMLVLVAVFCVAWVEHSQDVNFRGIVNFDAPWQIEGTEVTATAAELNKMDGVTLTTAQINDLSDFTIAGAGTTLTNATQTLVTPGSNLGFLLVGDGTNNALIEIGTDASVTSIAASGTVATTDSGSTLAVYDNGTSVGIKNRSGSNSTIQYFFIN